ncbi:MAG: DUF3108 domain-containing protein [Proteobacteria bacterium]|nr:DUF3108 domain-containing protein [Pseudomonadota bacterium]
MTGWQAWAAIALAAWLVGAAGAPLGRADTASGPAAPATLTYVVYFGGLKALALEVQVGVTSDGYQVRMSAQTQGVIDWVVGWTARASSEGTIRDGVMRPERHVTESQFRGNRRDAALTFRRDGSIDSVIEPSAEADDREPVTPEQELGALDPIAAVLLATRALATQQTCDQRVPVFDGRRRYDVEFRDGGRDVLKPSEYGSFSGEATLCLFRYIRIAGYQKTGRWNNARDYDRIYRSWLAPVAPGLPPLPVRIEAEGTFGTVIVHLVGVGRQG